MTVCVFLRMQTQWRHSMNGPTGLDYNALFPILDLYGITEQEQRQDIFDGIQIMELTILKKTVKK